MKLKTLLTGLLITALASSQVAFVLAATPIGQPITPPITNPISTPTPQPTATPSATPTPTPTPAPSYSAPTMVYPQNNQAIDLEGAYMFKINPVNGASGYLYGFFQDGQMVFENYRDLHTLSSTSFNIRENDPAHAKFHAGDMQVWIRALVNGQWTDARVINVPLKPRPTPTPTPTPLPAPIAAVLNIFKPAATVSPTPAPKPVVQTTVLSGTVNYRMITYLKWFNFVFPIQSIVTPASGATIELTNDQTREKVYASTNWFGVYSVNVKKGQYSVRVSDAKKTSFNPAVKAVDVTSNTSNILFEGVLQTFRFW